MAIIRRPLPIKRARSRASTALPLERGQRLLTVREVADMLFVTRAAIHQMIRRGELRAWYIGDSVRLRRADVNQYARAHPEWIRRHRERHQGK